MCCFFTVLLFLGPRVAGVVWWIFRPAIWNLVFSSIIWPILGLIFLPWATLMYVIVAPGGVVGIWEWGFLILAIVADIASYTGGGYGNKEYIPGMS